MKLVIFSEAGHPVGVQALPPGAVAVADDTPLRDAEGRLLRPDGSYRPFLGGEQAFGGHDGRQPVTIAADLDGLDWPDLAARKSDEHPCGLLREPRPETAAEKKAREKAEAEVEAKAEAEAKAAAEAAERERIAALEVTDYQLALALVGAGIISQQDAEAYVSVGALPAAFEAGLAAMPEADRAAARIKIMGAKTIKRSDPIIIALAEARGSTPEDVDALFVAASSL